MVRVAGIDCGTNSIKMEIADASFSPSGPKIGMLVPRKVWTIRLGEGVDKTRLLSFFALKRLRCALESFKEERATYSDLSLSEYSEKEKERIQC